MPATLLHDLLRMDEDQLTPLYNNIVASQLQILFYKLCVEFTAWVRLRQSSSLYTKLWLHLSLSFATVFWVLFDDSHWSWRLNALLPAVVMARCFYKGAISKDPDDLEVRTQSRTSSPADLLFGTTQFAALLVWLGLYQFRTEASAVILGACGVGDGLAPLVGALYGRHDYQVPVWGDTKTMEGSVVGVFLGSVVGCYLFTWLLGIPMLPLRIVLVYGGIAAVVEGTAPGNVDNLSIPVVLILSMDKVKEMLPN